MSDFVSYAIGLTVFSVILIILNAIKNLAIGRYKPREPKDEGKDDPLRSQIVQPDSPPPEALFQNNLSHRCPLHEKSYIGVASLAFINVPSSHNIFQQESVVDNCLQIGICEDCKEEVFALRKNKFKWKHSNYKEHPSWASSHILPHLLGDKIAIVFSIMRKTENKWEECLIDKIEELSQKNVLNDGESAQKIVQKYNQYFTSGDTIIGDNISEKKIRKSLKPFKYNADESPLLVMQVGMATLSLLTDKNLYIKDKTYSLRDINSIEKKARILHDSSDFIININEEQYINYPSLMVDEEKGDSIIAVLGELSALAKNK